MNKLRLAGFLLLVAVLATTAWAKMPTRDGAFDGGRPTPRPTIIDNTSRIDANNIEMIVTNHGSFAYDLPTQTSGMWFPRGTENTCVYASGLWVGCQIGGKIHITAGSFAQEYGPGPILPDGSWDNPADPRHKVYKITKGDVTSDDYLNWPADLGAPVDGEGKPLLIGDQTLWCIYNDANPELHVTDEGSAGETPPLGIEVQQTTFAFDWKGALGNTVFIKFKIINKGQNRLDSTYVAVWADPDLGGSGDDYVGCDTTLSMGFVYNATNNDQLYGSNPPAVGYDFFQGPIGDDQRELPMVSFNKYINGTDPRTAKESYNYMRGLNLDGSAMLDPLTGEPTTFAVPGDPVANTGWLDADPADRRFMLNSGPFTMAPGDTQEVVIGIVIGQGKDRIGSVRVMKFYDQTAQVAFNLDFDLPEPPVKPEVRATDLDREIRISWGMDSEVHPGDYAFEGYNVYQSASVSTAGPWTLIATYDKINGVQTVEDRELNLEFGLPIVQPVQFGTDAGVKRFIELSDDMVLSVPLANGTPYYYRVGAYSHNAIPAEGLPKTLESLSSIMRIIPQEPVAGKVLSDFVEDVEHGTTGGVDPSDEALDVQVIDPFAVTGHDYKITYVRSIPPDTLPMLGGLVPYPFDYHWKLTDETTDQVLYEYGINRNGNDDYPVIDGFVPRVIMGIPIGRVNYVDAAGDPSGVLEGSDVELGFSLNGAGGQGAGYGTGFFGSVLSPAANYTSFPTVEIRFSDTAGQKGYRYTRPDYPYTGFFDLPFTAWDVDAEPERQLNVCWVEWTGSGIADTTWLPNDAWHGGREYVFIMNSDYDPAGTGYDDLKYGLSADVLYCLWLLRPDTSVPIPEGSKIVFVKSTPSTDADFFTFSTTAPAYDAGQAKSALDAIKVVPNPYFAHSSYELNQFTHVVKFTNLPEKCSIRIFNLAGDLVKTLEKNNADTSIMEWNLFNEANLPVASGFYVYHVDAPGIGTTFGKMAIFLEKERLNTF